MILKAVRTTLKKANGNYGNEERQQATLRTIAESPTKRAPPAHTANGAFGYCLLTDAGTQPIG